MNRTLSQLLEATGATQPEEVTFNLNPNPAVTPHIADEQAIMRYVARASNSIPISSEEADILRDASAVEHVPGGYLQIRKDIAPSERCFVAIDEDKKPLGFLQIYANGTSGYWREAKQQAQPAQSSDEALRRLLAARIAA